MKAEENMSETLNPTKFMIEPKKLKFLPIGVCWYKKGCNSMSILTLSWHFLRR